jgi:hypothetical protein
MQTARKRPRRLSNELVPYRYHSYCSHTVRQPTLLSMLKREGQTVRKYPRPKMTGENNEGTEHGHDKLEEKSSREEPTQEKEDTKAANSQGKSKSGSDSSDPVDNYSDKNGNVHLSFPERVSCCMSGRICFQMVCFDDVMAFVMRVSHSPWA